MNTENYLDELSSNLLELKEISENIYNSGMEEKQKEKALEIINKKYNKIHCIFKKTLEFYLNE